MSSAVLHQQQPRAAFGGNPAPLPRVPSSDEVRELGQILSLLHTAPPRTVFADQERAWQAVVAARELHKRALWGAAAAAAAVAEEGAVGDPAKATSPSSSSRHAVDTAIQLVTILLDAAERLRRDGVIDEAAGLLDDAIRYSRATRMLVPFMPGGERMLTSPPSPPSPGSTAEHRTASLSSLFKAEAEACMRFALLLVPARDMDGELIGLPGAYALIEDAANAESASNSNDWQAAQMIGLVSDAIATALSWQRRQERVASSILEGVRYRAVYDEEGGALEVPVEIAVTRPIASDAAELEAKLSARRDLTVRFGNLGEALDAADDDDGARLPPGAGVIFQCWVPCVEAFVTDAGLVRLRSQEYSPQEYMIRELSVVAAAAAAEAGGAARPLDLVRLETPAELHVVLRMLHNNLRVAGVADETSAACLPALSALFRVVLGEECPPVALQA